MVDYLILRDKNFRKIKAIDPIEYRCSVGKKENTKGDLRFKLYLQDGLIEEGSFVTYADTIYGGIITKADIDLKKKIVTYYGKSFWGLLNNLIVRATDTDFDLEVRSGETRQRATSKAEYAFYPSGGPFPFLHWACEEKFDHGIELAITDIIPLDEGTYETYNVAPGTTVADVVDHFMNLHLIGNGFWYKCSLAVIPNNADKWLKLTWKKSKEKTIDLSYNETQETIITRTMKPSEMVDKFRIFYVKPDNEIGNIEIPTTSDSPTPAYTSAYPKLSRFQIWKPSDDTGIASREKIFQKLRADYIGGITTNIISVLNNGDSDDLECGDRVTLIYRPSKINLTQTVTEKIFTLSKGLAKVETILG